MTTKALYASSPNVVLIDRDGELFVRLRDGDQPVAVLGTRRKTFDVARAKWGMRPVVRTGGGHGVVIGDDLPDLSPLVRDGELVFVVRSARAPSPLGPITAGYHSLAGQCHYLSIKRCGYVEFLQVTDVRQAGCLLDELERVLDAALDEAKSGASYCGMRVAHLLSQLARALGMTEELLRKRGPVSLFDETKRRMYGLRLKYGVLPVDHRKIEPLLLPFTPEAAKDWDEERHPRDEQGRFTSGGGGGDGDGGSGESKFNADEWNQITDVGARKEAWAKLSEDERDKIADAPKSVAAQIVKHMDGMPERPNTENLTSDARTRARQFSDRLPTESVNRVEYMSAVYAQALRDGGLADEAARPLVMMATEALACQDLESFGRQLGDHGVHHIGGNIATGSAILAAVHGEDDAKSYVEMITAQLFHDTGYLAAPSQNFLDEGHPRWSAQFYDAHIKGEIEKSLGKESADRIGEMIRTHDATEIDWEQDPVSSAVRVADNTSLFQAEKLPPIFRYAGKNLDSLRRLGAKEIDLETAKKEMHDNIDEEGRSMPDRAKAQLHKAVDEVSPFTVKMTLGMLGGDVTGVKWEEDHLVMELKPNKDMTKANALLDLGQAQMAKFAKSYGMSGDEFKKTLNFKFAKAGKVLLEGRIIGERGKSWSERLEGREA